MASFLKSNANTVAFGLTWTPAAENKKSAAAFAKRRRFNFQIEVPYGKRSTYGFAQKSPGLKGRKNYLSCAALFFFWSAAYARDTASELNGISSDFLLAFSFKDDSHKGSKRQVALIAVVNNEIYRDLVVGELDAEKTIKEIKDETGADFEIFSNMPELLPESTPIDLQKLLAGQAKKAQMTALSTVNYSALAGFTLGLAAIAGGIAYWYYLQEQAEAEKSAAQIDPIAAYQANILSLTKNIHFSGQTAATQIWPKIGASELTSVGWNLSRIDCSRSQCKESWKRGSGTNADFAAAHKSCNVYFVDENNIEYVCNIKTVGSALNIKTLPSSEEFNLKYISLNQQLSPLASIAKVQFAIEKPVAFGVPEQVTLADIPAKTVMRKGKVSVKAPLGMYPDMFADLPANMTIQRVDINLQGGVSAANVVTVTGEYFVK